MSGGVGFRVWGLGPSSKRFAEIDERFDDGVRLGFERSDVVFCSESDTTAKRELTSEFERAALGNLDETSKVSLALARAPLGDVAHDADCSAPHLLTEPKPFFSRELPIRKNSHHSYDIRCELEARAVNGQIFGITHALPLAKRFAPAYTPNPKPYTRRSGRESADRRESASA